MRHVLFALAAAALVIAPVAGRAQSAETILEDLDYPWDVEAHAGVLFLTEKSGTLGVVEDGVLTRWPVLTSAPILDDRGGGLLGLALRPDFAETRRAVLYHHYGTPEKRMNRVIEVVRAEGGWRETRILVDGIPGHPLYNGGRIAFGPDGMLYIATGWTEDRALPQDPGSLAGKILRVAPDGAVPADNPFPGSPVWSLGHRNPQGLAWDADGRLYVAEHGQSGNDEVNLVEAGGNYGWPLIEGDATAEGLRPPLVHSGRGTWAPSGLAWDGERLLLAGLRAGGILAIDPESGAIVETIALGERVRDVVVLDGEVLAITTNRSPRRDGRSHDRLVRIGQ